jgi:hypothetical protein
MKTTKNLLAVASLMFLAILVLAACGAATPAKSGEEPELLALQALATQLKIDPKIVTITGSEPAQWPDACLGIQAMDETCATMVVPGYRIALEAGGQSYEYRTSEDGSILVAVPRLSLRWQEEGQCREADLGYESGVSYGSCDGAMTTAPFAQQARVQELAGFGRLFASLTAETPVGELTFFGGGEQAMSPVEQRRMAEWARVAVEQVGGGSIGPVIAWHREGGIAGFCDDLTISTVGDVLATSCKGTQGAEEMGRYRLAPDELEQLYTWVDTLKPFEAEQTDAATTDAMTVRLAFRGQGTTDATQDDKLAIESFATDLYLQLGE